MVKCCRVAETIVYWTISVSSRLGASSLCKMELDHLFLCIYWLLDVLAWSTCLVVISGSYVGIDKGLLFKWWKHEPCAYLLGITWADGCCVCVFMWNNGLGAFLSKLTEFQPKSNRMLYSGNVWSFQWYLTGAQAFSGVLRKLRSFSATELFSPNFYYWFMLG